MGVIHTDDEHRSGIYKMWMSLHWQRKYDVVGACYGRRPVMLRTYKDRVDVNIGMVELCFYVNSERIYRDIELAKLIDVFGRSLAIEQRMLDKLKAIYKPFGVLLDGRPAHI